MYQHLHNHNVLHISSMVKKIVIIGPESTGKSSLCQQLAVQYSALWVPEYAREYLAKHGMNYTYDDLLHIAKGQINLEEEYTKKTEEHLRSQLSGLTSHVPLFIDTNMYVMKVWCEFVFGKCHQWILDQIKIRSYDLYILCNIDLPWIKDELREYPDVETRQVLYTIYKNILQEQTIPWVEVSGDYNERFLTAKNEVDRLID